MTCDYDGAYCKTHGCGIRPDGGLAPCRHVACPHCGKSKSKPANVPLLMRRLKNAQARMESWERKLARAATATVECRAEVRRLWKKLEAAGVAVDPMDVPDVGGEDES